MRGVGARVVVEENVDLAGGQAAYAGRPGRELVVAALESLVVPRGQLLRRGGVAREEVEEGLEEIFVKSEARRQLPEDGAERASEEQRAGGEEVGQRTWC